MISSHPTLLVLLICLLNLTQYPGFMTCSLLWVLRGGPYFTLVSFFMCLEIITEIRSRELNVSNRERAQLISPHIDRLWDQKRRKFYVSDHWIAYLMDKQLQFQEVEVSIWFGIWHVVTFSLWKASFSYFIYVFIWLQPLPFGLVSSPQGRTYPKRVPTLYPSRRW
jgi:hypothetical protein